METIFTLYHMANDFYCAPHHTVYSFLIILYWLLNEFAVNVRVTLSLHVYFMRLWHLFLVFALKVAEFCFQDLDITSILISPDRLNFFCYYCFFFLGSITFHLSLLYLFLPFFQSKFSKNQGLSFILYWNSNTWTSIYHLFILESNHFSSIAFLL